MEGDISNTTILESMVDQILDLMQSRGLMANEADARAVIEAVCVLIRLTEHDWRAPEPGEALEEGGFCRLCGRPASEAAQPCEQEIVT